MKKQTLDQLKKTLAEVSKAKKETALCYLATNDYIMKRYYIELKELENILKRKIEKEETSKLQLLTLKSYSR